MIHVRKQDVLNIQSIDFMHKYTGVNLTSSSIIDLSKLENLCKILKFTTIDEYELKFLSIIDLLDRYCGSAKFNIEGLCFIKKL